MSVKDIPQIVLVNIQQLNPFKLPCDIYRRQQTQHALVSTLILVNARQYGTPGKYLFNIFAIDANTSRLQEGPVIPRKVININRLIKLDIAVIEIEIIVKFLFGHPKT